MPFFFLSARGCYPLRATELTFLRGHAPGQPLRVSSLARRVSAGRLTSEEELAALGAADADGAEGVDLPRRSGHAHLSHAGRRQAHSREKAERRDTRHRPDRYETDGRGGRATARTWNYLKELSLILLRSSDPIVKLGFL